jgi:hypothetical protein
MTSLTQTQQFFVPLDVQDRNISQSGQAINEEWESSLVQQNHGSLNGEDRNSSKSGRITNEEWESVKGEIEQIYIDQGKTLSATMQMIEEKYHLKARQVISLLRSYYSEQGLTPPSERKWKLKLKEWGFEKYLPATAMKILVAKAERRAVVENKDTVFFHGKTQIAPERIDLFKKRKAFREGPMASPSQST